MLAAAVLVSASLLAAQEPIDARGTEHVGQTTKIGEKTTVYVGGDTVPAVPSGDATSTL